MNINLIDSNRVGEIKTIAVELNRASAELLFSSDAQTSITIAAGTLLLGLMAGFIVGGAVPALANLVVASPGLSLLYQVLTVLAYVQSHKRTSGQLRLALPSMIFVAGVILSLLRPN